MNRSVGIICLVMLWAVTAIHAADGLFPKPTVAELPVYPERARTARVARAVKLWFLLDANGRVSDAGVTAGNPLLRDAALRNVESWKFRPGSLAPQVRLETEFVYMLGVQQKPGEPKLTVTMVDFRLVEVVSELYVETIE